MNWHEELVFLESNLLKTQDKEILEKTLEIFYERWKDCTWEQTDGFAESVLEDIKKEEFLPKEESKYLEYIHNSLFSMAEAYSDEQSLDDDLYVLESVFAYIKIRHTNYEEIIKKAIDKTSN